MDADAFRTQFLHPGEHYRSMPFWAWNDRLDKDELVRQIGLMHDAGFGGFFMHSRDGLETPYIGPEWDACVKACAEEAAQYGMHAWMYDEDRWPSGFCGGRVQQQVGSLKGLTLEMTDKPAGDFLVVALWAVVLDSKERIVSLRRLLSSNEELQSGEICLVARVEGSKLSPWFNGNPPPDNLNPLSEQTFLHLTHDHYKELFGDSFSSLIAGSFTDEPSLCDRHAAFDPHRGWIPWTDGFSAWAKEKIGYDLLEKIPYLYFQGDESSRVRFDYWKMIALRFETCYSGQIGKWCEQHGIAYTGHFLQEDKMGLCARVNGSIMPHYRHETVPGVDLLCEQTDEYLTLKQCASVAHQFGKKDVVAETYAATGWDFSFEGQKWIGDWLSVLGVNHRCHHLMLYSLRGSRKRDYPPCFNSVDSWWGQERIMEDYFARISFFISQGEVIRRVAVIHPMSTVWCHLGCDAHGNPDRNSERDIPPLDAYGYEFNAFLKRLCQLHIDVDLVDESLLAGYGSVENDCLKLQDASYSLVVVPKVDNLWRSTICLLGQLLRQGGTVLATKPLPTLVDGISEDTSLLFGTCPLAEDQEKLPELIEKYAQRDVSILENGMECSSILYQLRKDGTKWLLFLVNNDRNNEHIVLLKTSFTGNVCEWNSLKGSYRQTPVQKDGEGLVWMIHFRPCASALFVVDSAEMPCFGTALKMTERELVSLTSSWNVIRTLQNVMTLDTCSWYFDGQEPSSSMEVWRAQKEGREQLGMRPIDSDEVVQRYQWISKKHPKDGTSVHLDFSFQSETSLPLSLVVESAGDFTYRLDGKTVAGIITGSYLDRVFKSVSLGMVAKGKHTMTLSLPYKETSELEAIYLIGTFDVSTDRTIQKERKTIFLGDWTNQGLFHYPGNLIYKTSFRLVEVPEILMLDIGEFHGACAKVLMNGKEFMIPWKAERKVMVSSACVVGENQISVEIFGSPRNMLGPFHLKEKPMFCNPSCFMPDAKSFDETYHVVPYGLYGPVKLFAMMNNEEL